MFDGTGNRAHVHDFVGADAGCSLYGHNMCVCVWRWIMNSWRFRAPWSVSKANPGTAKVGHHGRIPGRVPDYLDFRSFDRFEVAQGVLHAQGDALLHRAAWRSQGHLDRDFAAFDASA